MSRSPAALARRRSRTAACAGGAPGRRRGCGCRRRRASRSPGFFSRISWAMRVMVRDICSAVSTTVSLAGLGSGIKKQRRRRHLSAYGNAAPPFRLSGRGLKVCSDCSSRAGAGTRDRGAQIGRPEASDAGGRAAASARLAAARGLRGRRRGRAGAGSKAISRPSSGCGNASRGGVQELALEALGPRRPAVLDVAGHRVAEGREVHPDLVRAARLEADARRA